ncbi:Leucine-rich repeat and calponin homology domain-containing protein 2, partial [Frankliniella fusca]
TPPSSSVSISNLVAPVPAAPRAVVQLPAWHVSTSGASVPLGISYAQQECPAGGRQTDFVESPASVWLTDIAPPQVVRGYSLDWHNFLHTPSVESATDDQEMYSNVSLNFNATPPDFLFDADNEAEPECQDSSNLQQKLYENSDISLHDSLVSLLTFAQSSHLTEVEFSKLLDLCHVLLRSEHFT